MELPEDALREAVTNAVCHRDNFEKGARVMVEIFDDRVEITNPGGAPKGITKENFGSISIARNPVIASLLHRAGYIERMGTGINRINAAMEGAGFNKPIFRTEGIFFKVIFERQRATVESDNSDRLAIGSDRLAIDSDKLAIGSDRLAIDSDKLAIENGDRISAILNYIETNGSGKNSDFVKLLGVSPGRVRQILQGMIKNDLIEKQGDKRHTYYTVKKVGDM